MYTDDMFSQHLQYNNEPPLVFAGSANTNLAQNVAHELGINLGERSIDHFPDGEIHVQIGESVRGRDTFVIQSTCPPVNEHLMELFIMLDTLRRAAAARVTAIIPYYGYSRQDRKVVGREPITAKLIANLLEAAGASRVLCVDLHSPAIQGFFEIGMDHLTAAYALTEHISSLNIEDAIVVSPDTGGVKRADTFAKLLNLPLAILHKRRTNANSVEIRAVIGDVKGKRPIIVDDIVATGGTLKQATEELLKAGALPEITIAATHAVLAGSAVVKLDHPAIKRIIVTDSIPLSPEKQLQLPSLSIVSLAPLMARAIDRLHIGRSISELFHSQERDEPTIPWSV